MNRTAVFSKTGKGLLEIKNRANKLTRDQYKVLGLVDGKASLVDLIDKARISEIELRKILGALSDGGYVKEFANPAGELGGATAPPSTAYVDDLDFTQILGPAKSKPSVYTSGESERRQREEAERKAAETAAAKAREEAERRAKEEAAAKAAAQAAALKVREEAERRARMEEERREQMAAQLRAKAEAEVKVKEEAERRAKDEIERKARIEAEVRARIEAERKGKEEALRKAREEEERRRKEEEERKRREEEERRRREEEERRRREEEERRRKEEEERKRREEEERRRKEEEERKRREEEERRRKEEEERKRREEEERRRKEEEERKRREEEERRRREEEERKRREEEERRRKEEEERQRKEEEERRRKEEAERLLRELEEKHQREQELLRQRMEEQRRRIEAGELVDPEEEERKRREEEERLAREAEERRREEEDRRRREEDERRRREEDERRRREEDERRRREEDERRRREEEDRLRREEENRLRRESEERHRREEEERRRREEQERAASAAFPTLDRVETPKRKPAPVLSSAFESQLDSLTSAEEQIEQELRLKEDAIRTQLEEQERRFRMEEEARAAMDRAEREEHEKADREAKELALAAERARKEAEQRSREEAVRKAQEEKEKRARDQEERRKQAEEERKKRERERREAEQRGREEELARRRKEQEEADRRKAELDRIQRETRKGGLGPAKIAAIALVALVALGIAAVEYAPLSAYAPAIEKLASDRLGEPVRIGNVRMSLLKGFSLKLDSVTVGVNQDVRIPSMTVYMGFGSLFAERKEVDRLNVESLTATQDVLPRLAGWVAGPEGGAAAVSVGRVTLKAAKLEVPRVALPTFDADIRLGPDGVRMATLRSNDGHLDVEIMRAEEGTKVQAKGRAFVMPLGPGLEFADFSADALIRGNQMQMTQLSYSLYGGQGKATGTVDWGNGWAVDANFELQRLELETAMHAVQAAIPSEGTLDAKGRLASHGASLDTALDGSRVEATFMVRKGNLSGLDLVRALQSPSRDGVTGGKTKFDEMSGNFSMAGGRYQYNGVKLQSGALNGSGQLDVAPDQEVNGRAYVELRSSASAIRGNFKILGTVKGMVLKP